MRQRVHFWQSKQGSFAKGPRMVDSLVARHELTPGKAAQLDSDEPESLAFVADDEMPHIGIDNFGDAPARREFCGQIIQ
jgi:hypothetical protein